MSDHENNKQRIERLQCRIDNMDNSDICTCFEVIKDILQDLCERVDEIEQAHEDDMDNTGSW